MEKPQSAWPGAVGSSISERASLASEIFRKISAQEERDAKVKAWLFEIAPKEIKQWIEDEDILGMVYLHGRYSLSARFDYKDWNDAKRITRDLNRVWKGLIRVKIWDEEDPDIEFTAINGTHG